MRGVQIISSLAWASCVAYLSERQPRPDDGVSKSRTPTSFLGDSERVEPDTKRFYYEKIFLGFLHVALGCKCDDLLD